MSGIKFNMRVGAKSARAGAPNHTACQIWHNAHLDRVPVPSGSLCVSAIHTLRCSLQIDCAVSCARYLGP